MNGYTIGRLARAAGVPTSTVRFYEKHGLLRPDARTDTNYRIYRPGALERLLFIRAAQANGFTLEHVGHLLSLRDGRTAPCREVQTLIEERLADLGNRLRQLNHLKKVLQASLEECRKAERTGTCKVIDGLEVSASASVKAGPTRTPAGKRRKNP
jgi:MerR family mercuric resistance operon transcriptional regulator